MIRRVPRQRIEGRVQPLAGPRAGSPEPAPASDAELEDAHVRAVSRALLALLSEELRVAPEHIREVVSRELTRVRRARRIVLHVHPDDLTLLEDESAYVARCALAGALSLRADPALTRGGCVIESNLGEIDARLETRLGLALVLLERGALA